MLKVVVLMLGLGAMLSSCETETLGEKMADTKALKPPPTLVEETFGRGATEITLLLAKAQSGYYEGSARDIRDGAALAIRELDEAGLMKVKVVDVAAGPAALASVIAAANGRNSGLFASALPQPTTVALAGFAADQRPPVINLTTPVAGAKVFNFGFDEEVSAAQGARHAIASGRRKIVLLAPDSFSAAQEAGLKAAIGQAGGSVSGTLRYGAGGAAELLARNRSVLDAAGAVVLAGEGNDVLSALRALKAVSASLQVVGTSRWPSAVFSDPAAAGVIVAAADPEAMGAVGARYQAAYKRPFSMPAALAYDSVAMMAGIARGTGAANASAETLTAKTGFRGVTGLFRLTPHGTIERRLGVYRVEGGRLVVVEPAAASF